MRPRIQGIIDSTQYDQIFDNTADGWAFAWAMFTELSTLEAQSGSLNLQFCGDAVGESCILIQLAEWGESNG